MDDANTNKQFRIYDSTKQYIRLSVDETIARGLNTWQGWRCSAGTKGLYIDYDGNMWVCNTASTNLHRFNDPKWDQTLVDWKRENNNYYPTVEILAELDKEFKKTPDAFAKILETDNITKSKNPGFIGNISNYELLSDWVTCPWKSCGCGADVILAKAKSDEYTHVLAVTNGSWQGKEDTSKNLVDTISDPVAVEMNFPIPYQILWDISRRCNYDCSYCWPAVHNRTDIHKDYDLLISISDKLITHWAKNSQIRWNFGGGEPTLHPKFINWLEYLNSRNQWTMVTSNGTRDYKYWREAVKHLNSINLSAHFDGLTTEIEEDRFVRNIEVICEHFDEHNDDHWLEIKIMAPPAYLERAVLLREKIIKLNMLDKPGANNRIKGFSSIVPIRSLGNSGKLVIYTDEQLNILRNQ